MLSEKDQRSKRRTITGLTDMEYSVVQRQAASRAMKVGEYVIYLQDFFKRKLGGG